MLASETNITKVDSMEMPIFFVPYLETTETEVLPFLADEDLELEVTIVTKETEKKISD